MKKLLRIMMVFMMMLGTACAQDQGAASRKEQNDDIYVFFTSDVHCGVNEYLGTIPDSYREPEGRITVK